jgi:tetratricopeptide (TPR) repeat protein
VLQRALEQYQAIVRLEPDSVEDHLLLGRIYRMNNETAKAENEFKTAVRLQPSSEEAVTMLAYLYNEQGNSARAVEILNSVPDTQRTARLYSALGYTYEQQRNFKKAIEAYRQAVKEDSDNLEAMRGLGQNLLNDDQNDAALAQYKTIIKADPQDAQSYMRIAELYRRLHKYDQALDALKKAQSYAPDSLEIPFNIAVLYQTQGRYDEAVTILKDLVSKSEKPGATYNPGERNNRAIFLERLSDLYHETGRYQLAVDTLRKMIDLGGDNVTRAYQEIVDIYRDGKMWTQATDAAKEGVAKLPNDRTLRMVLAVQMADTGHGEAALNSAKALLKGTPDDREVYLNLAQMTTRLKRFREAEQYIAKAYALAAKEDDKELATFIWGTVYERQKKYDEAEKMFKKVLASDSRNTQTLNYLGYMLADRGTRLHEALGYVKKAVELDPQNGAYLDSLGWAYFKLGDYDMAEATLRHASERIGSDPTLQDHLGELYAKTGRLKLAATHWERAIQEWNKSVPADVDGNDLQRVTKKLESAKTKLARQQASKQ